VTNTRMGQLRSCEPGEYSLAGADAELLGATAAWTALTLTGVSVLVSAAVGVAFVGLPGADAAPSTESANHKARTAAIAAMTWLDRIGS